MLGRYRLAVVAERQAHHDDVVVILLVLDDGHLGRQRTLDIHDDLLGVEGVVVVEIVPVGRPRRHKAFLVGGRRIGQHLDRRFAHLRVVEVQSAVLGDDVLTAIGDQEIVGPCVAVAADGG